MSHPNAFLAPKGRLQLARCIVDDGWSLRRAAERFQVSVQTAARWAGRYRELGENGMEDRSSRPLGSPSRIPQRRERRIIALRVSGNAPTRRSTPQASPSSASTDNGSCYRSHAFKDALGPDITHTRTRPYRPQTNGKVCEDLLWCCVGSSLTPAKV